MVRPASWPDAENRPCASVPLACSARWDDELDGADRRTAWIRAAVDSMSVVMGRQGTGDLPTVHGADDHRRRSGLVPCRQVVVDGATTCGGGSEMRSWRAGISGGLVVLSTMVVVAGMAVVPAGVASAAPALRPFSHVAAVPSGPVDHTATISSGYHESEDPFGNSTYAQGPVTGGGTTTDLNATLTLPGSPAHVTLSVQPPAGSTLVAGGQYGSGLTPGLDGSGSSGVVLYNAGIACGSNDPGDFADVILNRITFDGSGDITSFALQAICEVTTGNYFFDTSVMAFNLAPTAPHQGYYTYESDGAVTGFGNDNFLNYLGDLSYTALNQPIVGMTVTPDGGGYWMVAADGGIFAFGDAGFYGSAGALPLNRPIVGMAATPDGKGYWLVASDGGIFAYGDAGFYGSMGGQPLNRPIVGMAAHPGGGYWLVASDGGIFAFGGAPFHGSTGNITLNQPVVGMTATPSGNGYWFVAADGGIFAYGDAGFYGSTGGQPLNAPIVAMAATPTGHGYWLVAADGGIFTYGDAPFDGSLGNDSVFDVVGLAT